MAVTITEFFGYGPQDKSDVAAECRRLLRCPFLGVTCTKTLHDGAISGVCTLTPTGRREAVAGRPVICCPARLYAEDYKILRDVSDLAFGPGRLLLPPSQAQQHVHSGKVVVAFGKRWGGELRLPRLKEVGSFFVDWVLAALDEHGELTEFTAIEVQSIDTIGNYRDERLALLAGGSPDAPSKAGMNWENVHKRILPQLIYKGSVLQRERLCPKGLYFVCPAPVYEKLQDRLGNDLLAYPPQTGAITFVWYDPGATCSDGTIRALEQKGTFTTIGEQLARAFARAQGLPPPGAYERAVREALRK